MPIPEPCVSLRFLFFLYKRPIIFEDGKQIRDFINIKDVVNANLLVLEHDDADYKVFNVGGDKAWTVSAFYHTMERVVGRKKSRSSQDIIDTAIPDTFFQTQTG